MKKPMMKMIDSEQGNDRVLWFDNEGMGPGVLAWTVRAFGPMHDGDVGNVGIEFHGTGGPYMTSAIARRLGAALIAAADAADSTSEGEP